MTPDHPMIARRHLYWKYWEPRADWDGSRSYVLTKDGAIVAHAALVPCECLHGGRRIRVIQLIDWVARADVRGGGAAIIQHIAKLADAIVTANGSEFAWRILPFIGFKPSGTTVGQYARPIRPLLRLAGARHFHWRLAPQLARNMLWALQSPSFADGSWTARRLERHELGRAPIPWPSANAHTAVFERTLTAMTYLLSCPAAPMEFYAAEQQRSIRGYFVLTLVPAQARIADVWADSDDPSDWRAVLHLAVQQAKSKRGVAEVVAIASDPLLDGALRACGFHRRATRPLLIRAESGTLAPEPPPSIRVQMLDDDSAYLHDGTNSFWA